MQSLVCAGWSSTLPLLSLPLLFPSCTVSGTSQRGSVEITSLSQSFCLTAAVPEPPLRVVLAIGWLWTLHNSLTSPQFISLLLKNSDMVHPAQLQLKSNWGCSLRAGSGSMIYVPSLQVFTFWNLLLGFRTVIPGSCLRCFLGSDNFLHVV